MKKKWQLCSPEKFNLKIIPLVPLVLKFEQTSKLLTKGCLWQFFLNWLKIRKYEKFTDANGWQNMVRKADMVRKGFKSCDLWWLIYLQHQNLQDTQDFSWRTRRSSSSLDVQGRPHTTSWTGAPIHSMTRLNLRYLQ